MLFAITSPNFERRLDSWVARHRVNSDNFGLTPFIARLAPNDHSMLSPL
jgi:hypothetical protein